MSIRLSLVMIVRDEAEMVADFLASVRGLWDELIVVDTGSRDDTPALFEAAGASVLHEPWHDDFAHARNVSLDAATGDWVLVLDADERPTPGLVAELRARIEDPGVGALTLRVSNALPYGHRRESRALRAWRNDPAVRFRHAIHEDASAAVGLMLTRTSTTLSHVDAPVDHLGYVRTRAAARDKKSRDLGILQRCILEDPFDFYSRLKVLEVARYWHDDVLWHQAAREANDALDQAGHDVLSGTPWGGELIALISEGLFAPDEKAGLVWLDAWVPCLAPAPPLFHRRALLHEHQGNHALASADFERCLALGEAAGDLQLQQVRPRLGLARVAIAQGNAEAAVAHATRALEFAPRDPEALVAVATLRRALQGPRALDQWEASHRAQHPACPERDWAVGEALYTLKDYKGAITRLRVAAGVPPAGPAAVRLGHALLADGQLQAAEALCHQLLSTEPEAGLGVLVFDLLRGRSSALELELTQQAANAAMRHWIDALLAAKQPAWRKVLTRNAVAVQDLFPWLGEYLSPATRAAPASDR